MVGWAERTVSPDRTVFDLIVGMVRYLSVICDLCSRGGASGGRGQGDDCMIDLDLDIDLGDR